VSGSLAPFSVREIGKLGAGAEAEPVLAVVEGKSGGLEGMGVPLPGAAAEAGERALLLAGTEEVGAGAGIHCCSQFRVVEEELAAGAFSAGEVTLVEEAGFCPAAGPAGAGAGTDGKSGTGGGGISPSGVRGFACAVIFPGMLAGEAFFSAGWAVAGGASTTTGVLEIWSGKGMMGAG
jgi:hypothetical protein